MVTRPAGQGPRRRRPRRRHTTTHDNHDEDQHAASESDDTDPTRRPGPVARHLTDPAIEAAIARFVATAPPLPEDLRARLARMLRTNTCTTIDEHAA